MTTNIELNGQIGKLKIRQNETQIIAYIQFEDGSDDTKYYAKDETEGYIINDLIDYYGYTKVSQESQFCPLME